MKEATAQRKETASKEQMKLERRASLLAAREAKRGKIAKTSGDAQLSAKALLLLRRRRAQYRHRHRSTTDLARVPYHRTRQLAGAVVVAAAAQQYLAIRVFYLLEDTGAWSEIANISLVMCAATAAVASLAQHWTTCVLFFSTSVAAMFAVMCNILTNLQTYVFLADIATDCFSPIEINIHENTCYDTNHPGRGGRSAAQCVCTDGSVNEVCRISVSASVSMFYCLDDAPIISLYILRGRLLLLSAFCVLRLISATSSQQALIRPRAAIHRRRKLSFSWRLLGQQRRLSWWGFYGPPLGALLQSTSLLTDFTTCE